MIECGVQKRDLFQMLRWLSRLIDRVSSSELAFATNTWEPNVKIEIVIFELKKHMEMEIEWQQENGKVSGSDGKRNDLSTQENKAEKWVCL